MSLEWYVASRYLSARSSSRFLNLSTLIAIGGVCVGVMALIVVIGVMSGLQKELRDRILGTNPHIMVLTYGEGLRLDRWQVPLAELRKDPSVTVAEPFVYSEALIFQDVNYQQGVALRGITHSAADRLSHQLHDGEWDFDAEDLDLPGIVLGFRLASRLLVYPGDTVSLLSGHGAELTPAGFIPRFKKFAVVGTFKSGMYEYDNQMGYMSVQAAQDLLGLDESVTGLGIWIDDPWLADEVAERLEADLGFPYTLRDWKRMNQGLFSALKLEKLAMTVILLLIVLVAAFNIISTLIMVVTDKTREIGILRSMGMTARSILRVFMFQGMIIGIGGTALGLAGGLALSWTIDYFGLISLPGDVYLIDQLSIRLDPSDVALVAVLSVLISFGATIYPSRQAAKLTPVEAIRDE